MVEPIASVEARQLTDTVGDALFTVKSTQPVGGVMSSIISTLYDPAGNPPVNVKLYGPGPPVLTEATNDPVHPKPEKILPPTSAELPEKVMVCPATGGVRCDRNGPRGLHINQQHH